MLGAAVAVCLVAGLGRTVAAADESRSAPLAQELSQVMAAQKLEAFAVKDPESPDRYIAAMLFPGVQLLVVAGQPTSPAAVQAYLDQKRYADVYGVLQQAVVNDTKVFVQDLKANGLYAKSPDAVDIVYERVVNQTMFDGQPSKHKLTDAQYAERFTAADTKYARLLKVLVDGLKQTGTATP
jgi:hypothetical protein